MSAFTARRMKKRPSFGIRSVELARSGSGFGFTVSGQQPAILSNIVPHSPAHVAGLRAGDHVIAVNGLNVSKHTHEAVVEAIGQSLGILSLQIAEDYCSSSDDERDLNEPAPRNSGFFSDDEEYAGGGRVPWLRPIHVRGNSADSTLTEASIPPRPRPKKSSPKKMAKVGPTRSALKMPSPSKSKQVDLMGSEELHLTETEINSFLHPTLSELRQSIKQRNTQYNQIAVDESLYKAVVGYLGTIEMPKEKDPSSSNNLMAIRNCIKRLRVEKKVHTMVLMCIFEDKIVLINHHGLKLADYPSNQITFCGKCTDDKRFFGLVTTRSLDLDHEGFSSSCHVFMTEPVTDQVEMDRRAKAFQFELTYHNHDPQLCREFPSNADTIIHVVKATFGKNEEAAGGAASVASGGLSPAANSTTTSNSDSGIGFRDDNNQPANGADRVLMLDVQHQRFQMQNLNRLHEEDEPLDASRSPEKLDVRAMPLPRTAASSGDDSFNTERLDAASSADNIRQSMQKYLHSKHQHLKTVSEKLHTPTNAMRRPFPEAAGAIFCENFNSKVESRRNIGAHLMRTPSNRSVARSLEDLRDDEFSTVPLNSAETALLKSNPNLPAPLVRYLYNSESNLSQLSAAEVLSNLSNKSVEDSQKGRGNSIQAPGLRGSTILKPGDQYPSEPGVLRAQHNRPVSSQSRRSDRSLSLASQDEENGVPYPEGGSHDEDKNEKLGWSSRGSSVRKHLVRRSLSSSKIDQLGQDSEETSWPPTSKTRVKGENKENDVVITDELDENSSQNGSLASDRGVDIGRVGMWATDFEKLLHDPVGLQTFTEFLKKEFSAENIFFWVACERYRHLENESERHTAAIQIMDRHLSAGAPDPVNVDSHARQAAQDGMATTTPTMFNLAQKQIYNLMKFDSFSRFLKSELYKESLLAEMSGNPLPFANDLEAPLTEKSGEESKGSSKEKSSLSWGKKSSKADVENRRRSLLPWGNLRGKDRSKSKERSIGESELRAAKSMTLVPSQGQHKLKAKSRDDLSQSSRASLTSADVSKLSNNSRDSSLSHNADCEGCTLARVILPDKATTVVQTRNQETIRAMVSRLLDKRGLKYTSFGVFAPNLDKPLDLSEDCSTLGCTEVRVEPRVLFRLELPSKKSIGVKAKPAKIVKDVLGPILSQYGWNLDEMRVKLDISRIDIDLEDTVQSIDNSRLVVTGRMPTEEVNSRLFEDMMRSKRPHNNGLDDQRSVRTDSSNESSTRIYKKVPGGDTEKQSMPPPERIPMKRGGGGSAFAKPKNANGPPSSAAILKNTGVTEELYEGLKLAQRGRLDDQRGTEINFEMPDFLKRGDANPRPNQGKENSHPFQSPLSHRQSEPIISNHRLDVFPPDPRLSTISSNNFYSQIENDYHTLNHPNHPSPFGRPPRDSFYVHNRSNDSNFSQEGYLPNSSEADRFFNLSNHSGEFSSGQFNESRVSLGFGNTPYRRGASTQPHHSLPPQSLEPPQNLYETLSHYKSGWNTPGTSLPPMADPTMLMRREPPPLPPKPKFGRMGRPNGVSSEIDMPMHQAPQHQQHQQQQQQQQQPRGYSVSFV